MFSHLLLPVDASAASDRAVHAAAATAKAFGVDVSVVCAVDPYPFSGVGADMVFAQGDYLDAATAEAKLAVGRASQHCETSGVMVSIPFIQGQSGFTAVIEPAEAAGAAGVDLFVMGSHGGKGLENLILASVTVQVLFHCHLPLMVVRA